MLDTLLLQLQQLLQQKRMWYSRFRLKIQAIILGQTCKEMEVLLRLTGREMLVETIYVQQQKPVFLTRKQMEIMELPTTGLQ